MTDLARSFPTGVTILRMLAIVRWLAWGWMVAVVAFSGDAVRHPVVAWLAVIAGLALAAVSTWWMRSSPGVLITPAFVAVEGAYALALTVLDGWVFEPGHVFVTSQNLASQWPLIAAISIGVAAGPFTGAAFGLLIGPARWAGAELNGFESVRPEARRVARRRESLLCRLRRGLRMADDAAAACRAGDRRSAGA